jgi:hypothetical protein
MRIGVPQEVPHRFTYPKVTELRTARPTPSGVTRPISQRQPVAASVLGRPNPKGGKSR